MGLRIVSVKLDDELVEMIDRYAAKKRLTRSEVIREAIRKAIAKSREIEEETIAYKTVRIYT